MSLDVQTIVKWDEGVKLYDAGHYLDSVEKFREIGEVTSKIWFDIGSALLNVGKLHDAVEAFSECVKRDEHLAIGYFQRGVCWFKLGRYRDAVSDWRQARQKLRGRSAINYSPVNLQHVLYHSEILYNHALSVWFLSDQREARDLLQEGSQLQATDKHQVLFSHAINAIQAGVAFDLLELPTRAIFRPDKTWLASVNKKDYLGKAKVVATLYDDQQTGFSGRYVAHENPCPTSQPATTTKIKRKGIISRSLENLLDFGSTDHVTKTTCSKSNEDIIGDKKGTNVCVSVRQDQLEFLRQNVPLKAPPRVPHVQPSGPQKGGKGKVQDRMTQPQEPPRIQPPPRVPTQRTQPKVLPPQQAQPNVPPKLQPPPKVPHKIHSTPVVSGMQAQPVATSLSAQPKVPQQQAQSMITTLQTKSVPVQPRMGSLSQAQVSRPARLSHEERISLQSKGRETVSEKLHRKSGMVNDNQTSELADILRKRREISDGNS